MYMFASVVIFAIVIPHVANGLWAEIIKYLALFCFDLSFILAIGGW